MPLFGQRLLQRLPEPSPIDGHGATPLIRPKFGHKDVVAAEVAAIPKPLAQVLVAVITKFDTVHRPVSATWGEDIVFPINLSR